MKNINLIKAIPFITTLFIVIFLFINNQKVITNLRILIWKTPTLFIRLIMATWRGSMVFMGRATPPDRKIFIKNLNGFISPLLVSKIQYKFIKNLSQLFYKLSSNSIILPNSSFYRILLYHICIWYLCTYQLILGVVYLAIYYSLLHWLQI